MRPSGPPVSLAAPGRTRPGGRGEAVAKWVLDLARQRGDAEYELAGIAGCHLPHLEEAMPPSIGQYALTSTETPAQSQRTSFGTAHAAKIRQQSHSGGRPPHLAAARSSKIKAG